MSKEVEDGVVEVRVSGHTPSPDLAKSIASHIRNGKSVVLVAIGHNAIGQAVKAVPVLNGFLAARGQMFSIMPTFETREIKDEHNTTSSCTVMLLKLIQYTFR